MSSTDSNICTRSMENCLVLATALSPDAAMAVRWVGVPYLAITEIDSASNSAHEGYKQAGCYWAYNTDVFKVTNSRVLALWRRVTTAWSTSRLFGQFVRSSWAFLLSGSKPRSFSLGGPAMRD